jgi:hypothetical protein
MISPPAIRIPSTVIPKNFKIKVPPQKKINIIPNIYMVARLICFFRWVSASPSVNAKKTGTAPNGFTIENMADMAYKNVSIDLQS